jgi:hypothetical protein
MYFDEVDMHALCSVSEVAEKAEEEAEKEAEKDTEKESKKEAGKEAEKQKVKVAYKAFPKKKVVKKFWEPEGLEPPPLAWGSQGRSQAELDKDLEPLWTPPPLIPHYIQRGEGRACGCPLPLGAQGPICFPA